MRKSRANPDPWPYPGRIEHPRQLEIPFPGTARSCAHRDAMLAALCRVAESRECPALLRKGTVTGVRPWGSPAELITYNMILKIEHYRDAWEIVGASDLDHATARTLSRRLIKLGHRADAAALLLSWWHTRGAA